MDKNLEEENKELRRQIATLEDNYTSDIKKLRLFERELGIKVVFLGFGLDSDNLHSPNEKFNLANFYKGIETIPYFHKFFAESNS